MAQMNNSVPLHTETKLNLATTFPHRKQNDKLVGSLFNALSR
jgi:hypothetical protein